MTEVVEQPTQEIKQFELVNVEIEAIELDPSNPNVMTKEQMAAMRKSMTKYGYLAPVILDKNYKICDGEHRVLIYKELGLTTIPAYILDLDSGTDRKQLRQVMNKLHGFHDKTKDAAELLEILEHSRDHSLQELSELIAQPREDLERLVLRYNPGLEFVTPENQEEIDRLIDEEMKRIAPDAQLGDLYQLGNHRIICADATDERSRQRLLGEGSRVDMVFTDPPYNIMGSSHGHTKLDDDNMIRPFFKEIAYAIKNTLKQDGHAYICCNWRSFPTISYEFKSAGLDGKNLIVWHKPNLLLGSMYASSHEFIYFVANENVKHLHPSTPERHVRTVTGETNVWTYNMNTDQTHEKHMVSKPIVVVERAIKNSSDKEDLVLDLFLGSGSTVIACEQTGRKCYGVEIDPHYVDVCIKRWEKYTGKKAVKLQ